MPIHYTHANLYFPQYFERGGADFPRPPEKLTPKSGVFSLKKGDLTIDVVSCRCWLDGYLSGRRDTRRVTKQLIDLTLEDLEGTEQALEQFGELVKQSLLQDNIYWEVSCDRSQFRFYDYLRGSGKQQTRILLSLKSLPIKLLRPEYQAYPKLAENVFQKSLQDAPYVVGETLRQSMKRMLEIYDCRASLAQIAGYLHHTE